MSENEEKTIKERVESQSDVFRESFIHFLCEAMSIPPSHETKGIWEKVKEMKKGEMTEKVLQSMFCENTGAHILDSGGAYGRRYDKCKKITDWNERPELKWEGYMIRDTYIYLKEHLNYEPELDKQFDDYCELEENKDKGWLELMEGFLSDVLEVESNCHNTYNGDSILDGTLQYQFTHYAHTDYGDIVILQTHNGCDVRGGYSTPHVFSTDDIDMFLIDENDFAIWCRTCKLDMSSDDGFHLYCNGSSSISFKFEDLELEEENQSKDNKWIRYNEDTIFCPRCGAKIDIEGNGDGEIPQDKLAQFISKYWKRAIKRYDGKYESEPNDFEKFFTKNKINLTTEQLAKLRQLTFSERNDKKFVKLDEFTK